MQGPQLDLWNLALSSHDTFSIESPYLSASRLQPESLTIPQTFFTTESSESVLGLGKGKGAMQVGDGPF